MALSFSVIGVPGIPMVESGDDLSEIICGTLKAQNLTLENGDVLCLAQKNYFQGRRPNGLSSQC
jgi:coenzyme F420-0:L-glutamate ligase/coenzyme F420-1:gamma-L-glutamate ligase